MQGERKLFRLHADAFRYRSQQLDLGYDICRDGQRKGCALRMVFLARRLDGIKRSTIHSLTARKGNAGTQPPERPYFARRTAYRA